MNTKPKTKLFGKDNSSMSIVVFICFFHEYKAQNKTVQKRQILNEYKNMIKQIHYPAKELSFALNNYNIITNLI